MNIHDFYDMCGKTVADNLPQIIGVAVATVFLSVMGFIGSKLLRKQKDPIKGSLETPILPHSEKNSAQYFTDVIKRGSTLSFGDPASWTAGGDEGTGLVTLEEIWTPLRVADSQTRAGKAGTHENMTEKDQGTDLGVLFKSTNQALLILGGPGSGKSTSVAMFAVEAARDRLKSKDKPLPIWVNLGTVTTGHKNDALQTLLSGVSNNGSLRVKGGVLL